MIEKVCRVNCEGKEYVILKDEQCYFYPIPAEHIKVNRLTIPIDNFSNLRQRTKEAAIDAIEKKTNIDLLMESEGLTAYQAALKLMKEEKPPKAAKYYKINKKGMRHSIQAQIQRGLDTFACVPKDNALFRVWCYMLVNDELTPIARMRYSSTITALKWFEDNGWIAVDDDNKVITLL